MPQVKCRTLFNHIKYVDAEKMIQRPAVYGMVVHQQQLLVAKAQHTGKYVLPGGGIDKGEPIEQALIREIREETNIPVKVGEFLHFETDFFYYDPQDLAIHGFLFFYQCVPLSTKITLPDYHPDEGLEMPLWVDIASLSDDAFQAHGELIMQLIDRL